MPVKLLRINKSPREFKRFRIFIKDNNVEKHYDFGLDTGSTYIDHHDRDKRDAYLKRHLGNPIERRLINNLIPSPALFSMKLLWGQSTSLKTNLGNLQREFDKK